MQHLLRKILTSKCRYIILTFVMFFVFCIFVSKKYCDSKSAEINPDLLSINVDELGEMDDEKVLYIYNWVDYLPQEVIDAFQKITGITVKLDVFDSNEMLEIKLISSKSQYDLVCPSISPFFARQKEIGIYQKFDKKLLKFYDDLDPFIMEKMSVVDATNEYAIPYLWGVSGFAVSEEKIKSVFKNAPIESLSLVFEVENLKKISKYNVSFLNSPSEVFPILAHYMFGGENATEEQLNKMYLKLKELRPYIFKFNSTAMQDLFSETSCVAFGTYGNVRQIMLDAKRDGKDLKLKFIFPKEGGEIWIDVFAIPKNARHYKNAHVFLNYIYHPKVIAAISNSTAYANPIVNSKKYIIPEILNDELIFPSNEILKKSFIEEMHPISYERMRTKLFTKLKSGL